MAESTRQYRDLQLYSLTSRGIRVGPHHPSPAPRPPTTTTTTRPRHPDPPTAGHQIPGPGAAAGRLLTQPGAPGKATLNTHVWSQFSCSVRWMGPLHRKTCCPPPTPDLPLATTANEPLPLWENHRHSGRTTTTLDDPPTQRTTHLHHIGRFTTTMDDLPIKRTIHYRNRQPLSKMDLSIPTNSTAEEGSLPKVSRSNIYHEFPGAIKTKSFQG